MQFTYRQLKILVNHLDAKGLAKEAGKIIPKASILSSISNKIKSLSKRGKATAALLLLLASTQIQRISEEQIKEASFYINRRAKELYPEDFDTVKIKKGDTISSIAKESFPKLNEVTGIQIIKEYNENLDPTKIKIGQEIKIPKVDALVRIGWEAKHHTGLTGKGDVSEVSQNLKDSLKKLEGLRLKAYETGVGIGDLTIGYGHKITPKEKSSGKIYGIPFRNGISKKQADKIFNKDLERIQKVVDTKSYRGINQQQYDALVHFAFNVGHIPKTIDKEIRTGGLERVPQIMGSYTYADGEKSRGLSLRRNLESQIWIEGIYE